MSAGLPRGAFDLAPSRVRARFAVARRAGTPAWLWPGVPPEAWRVALEAIGAATSRVLAGVPARLKVPSGAVGALSVAAYTSGMGPMLGYWIEGGRLDAERVPAAVLRLHLRHGRERAARLTAETARLVSRLAEAGVQATVLKGMHTAHAYLPEPGTRPLSDVDLWIAADERRTAERVLVDAGYLAGPVQRRPHKREWRPRMGPALPRSLLLAHAGDPFAVDLHLSLDRNFFGVGTVALDRVAQPMEPWRPALIRADASAGIPVDGGAESGRPAVAAAGRVLGQPALTLLLAAHASEGLHNLTLLRLLELAMVIRRDRETRLLVWEELLEAADETGARRFAYPALRLCEVLAPGTLPARVLARFEAAAPPGLLRVVAGLTPATAQRLDGLSLGTRFMWAGTGAERLRRALHALWPAPAGYSLGRLREIYAGRAWRVLRRAGER